MLDLIVWVGPEVLEISVSRQNIANLTSSKELSVFVRGNTITYRLGCIASFNINIGSAEQRMLNVAAQSPKRGTEFEKYPRNQPKTPLYPQ
jgi:hypothetical protein